MDINKSTIQLKVKDKTANAYLAEPKNGGPGILVLPSWWGLKPFFKQVCDQLAEHGYTALALDYYNGRVGNTIEETQTLQQGVESDLDFMSAMIKAAKDHLVSLRPGKSIGVLGFSMGTDWAVITAAKEPDILAMVLFYGGYSGVDFSKMKSKVLVHYAEIDEWYSFDQAKDLEQKMKSASVDVTLHLYPGVAHWFMESDRPEYDPESAQLAWQRTFEFLKHNLH
jgi:carboxymethylenebutenolidase